MHEEKGRSRCQCGSRDSGSRGRSGRAAHSLAVDSAHLAGRGVEAVGSDRRHVGEARERTCEEIWQLLRACIRARELSRPLEVEAMSRVVGLYGS